MKISYKYNNYKDCPQATSLSRWAGSMGTLAFPMGLVMAVIFGEINDSHMIGYGFLGFVLGVAIFFGLAVYLKKQEAFVYMVFCIEKEVGRPLTQEEKKDVRRRLKDLHQQQSK